MDITFQLRDDHAELEHLAGVFRTMIGRPLPPDGIELVELRQIFSRRILAHLYREDVLLYPQLRKSRVPYVSTLAEAFQHEMGGLLDAYKAWALRWPTERILADWPRFGKETGKLLDALVERIDNENRKLYPLLERSMNDGIAQSAPQHSHPENVAAITNA